MIRMTFWATTELIDGEDLDEVNAMRIPGDDRQYEPYTQVIVHVASTMDGSNPDQSDDECGDLDLQQELNAEATRG